MGRWGLRRCGDLLEILTSVGEERHNVEVYDGHLVFGRKGQLVEVPAADPDQLLQGG